MIALSLQSGSNGNCIYVETPDARLLFDAGISGIQAERRLAEYGRDIRRVDAVIISHDHFDHVRCAGVFHRKYGLPVFISRRTLRAAEEYRGLGPIRDIRFFRSGGMLRFGRTSVETIVTPHDAADGVAFVVAAGNARVGILTDLGHVFDDLRDIVRSLDGVFIESNYDPEMLANGPYPLCLQERIRGPRGHLSNIESAELLRACGRRLQWACLAHLSEQNNRPRLALETHRVISDGTYPLQAASRYEPTGVFAL
jgi:phosphoribosyl 1,2-cyclic phosphodiesterase